jgi:hypothetical protein
MDFPSDRRIVRYSPNSLALRSRQGGKFWRQIHSPGSIKNSGHSRLRIDPSAELCPGFIWVLYFTRQKNFWQKFRSFRADFFYNWNITRYQVNHLSDLNHRQN